MTFALAALLTIVLTSCAPAPSGPVSRDSSPTMPTPAALTPSEYQTVLQQSGAALDSALRQVAQAPTYEATATEVTTAGTVVSEVVADLGQPVPPVAVRATHRDLVAAMREFATDLAGVEDQVASLQLCAAPSVIATLSTAPSMERLRQAAADLGSPSSGQPYAWGEFLPAPTPLSEHRLGNGQLATDQRGGGEGELEVENGTDQDAVVSLSQAGNTILGVYVTAGQTATAVGIPDGVYDLFYHSGAGWDEQLRTFTRACEFSRFDDPAEFFTIETAGGIEYTIQELTLQPVVGGNAAVSQVDPEAFPK
ncbi:MAG: hypothetical protein ACR2FQ_01305 [Pseudonocardiaceae bacterium]